MPAGSKMDLPLAKAKSISGGDNTSVIFKKERNPKLPNSNQERGVRETILQTPRSMKEEEEEEVLQAPEQRFPCSPW
ncbi:hypothetical protein llap_13976 [Limosa lapponica baueri]|uniref:Uncharacterized protein n=1 Tax=Limosa lapponica baueri TaxID=1758121 RepID=A0A2I0TPH6_LIMLA|nr:hypothetical protein llap_13976 [Limosa lapponica baueri]